MHDYTDFHDIPVYISPEATAGTLHNAHINGAPITILLEREETGLLDFLAKIIKAIGYDLDKDCNIRLFSGDDYIALKDIIKEDAPGYILAFGIDNKRVDTQAALKDYNWNRFENFAFLHSYSLRDLNKNQVFKKLLWSKLKEEFNG